jgi:hypothetical protein
VKCTLERIKIHPGDVGEWDRDINWRWRRLVGKEQGFLYVF